MIKYSKLETLFPFIACNKILKTCKKLHSLGFFTGCDGNVSYRLNKKEILITPSSVRKENLSLVDLSLVEVDSGLLVSGPKPSTELDMHLEIYRNTAAKAVIHSHPPASIGYSIAAVNNGIAEFPSDFMSEVIPAVGTIYIVPYTTPGTKQMARLVSSYLRGDCGAMILSRHGTLSYGSSLDEALNGTERIENSAKILKYARDFSNKDLITKHENLLALNKQQVEELKEIRKKIGDKLI